MTTDINTGMAIRPTDNSPKEGDEMLLKYQKPFLLTEEDIDAIIRGYQE